MTSSSTLNYMFLPSVYMQEFLNILFLYCRTKKAAKGDFLIFSLRRHQRPSVQNKRARKGCSEIVGNYSW
uniref:Uncharacterized protein n=1 Tax=Arundo donax TaxID=35708 RepID=A0A0A9F9D3_ARUDO